MKRTLLFSMGVLAGCLISVLAVAQNSIPNGDFESWSTATYSNPGYYLNSNQEAYYANRSFNCVQTTDSYHGSYALQLTTEATTSDTVFGYIVLNTDPDNNPSDWHGGVPFDQKPTGIRGYYKSDLVAGDTALLIVCFSAGGSNIGLYSFKLYGTHSTYTLFSFTFDPALTTTPDSVIFAAASSNAIAESGLPGSMLQLDSISFTGVTSQPADLDGDFESWKTDTIIKLDSWYLEDNRGEGVSRTLDAYKGTYAVELKTFLGKMNDHVAAQAGKVSTGYYPNNCNSNCNELGGFPFTNQADTLTFWYKYTPSGADSAQVSLQFKKNGNTIGWAGQNLSPSATYKCVEIPFSLSEAPDSVMVTFQSSVWQDSTVDYVGSDLFVDEAYFKSQIINTAVTSFPSVKNVSVYPNPASGRITVNINQAGNAGNIVLAVYNLTGALVKTENITSGHQQIDISNLSNGIYMLKFNAANFTEKQKLIIQR